MTERRIIRFLKFVWNQKAESALGKSDEGKTMKIIENKELIQNIKNLGFRFVTLDLEGIRSGGYDIENTRNSTKG